MTSSVAATGGASGFGRHDEATALIPAPVEELFAYLDKHSQLSAHMTKSSWMTGGGRMDMTTDGGGFRRLGSKLRLAGKAFGREPAGSRLRVFIGYDLPHNLFGRILGVLLAPVYARWCVNSMLAEAQTHFGVDAAAPGA